MVIEKEMEVYKEICPKLKYVLLNKIEIAYNKGLLLGLY